MSFQRFLCIATERPGDPSYDRLAASPVLEAKGYRPLVRRPAYAVYGNAHLYSIVEKSQNIVLSGTCFSRDGDPLSSLEGMALPRPLLTFSAMLETIWGSYIAFQEDVDGHIFLFRGPSAALPCYMLKCGDGLTLAGNEVRDLHALGGVRPTLCWPHIARHLRAIQYRDHQTALHEVTELLPGHATSLSKRREPVALWSPWAFVETTRRICDLDQAAERLGEVLFACARANGQRFSHALISLSGGLDSSIVSAGLAGAHIPCSAVTFLSGTASGDERRYAAAVAKFLDMPLFVRHLDDYPVDITRSDAAHVPRPTGRLFWQSADQIIREVADEIQADCHFHGGGGDNVFCYLQSVAPILDALYVNGAAKALSVMRDMGQLTNSDLWEVFRRTLRRRLSGRRHYCWPIDDSLLTKAAAQVGQVDFRHPWLEAPKTALPGSAAHIALLLAIQNYLEGYRHEQHIPVIAPLLSQPLIELCLRIPSWMWAENGINRAVVRKAFDGRLPQSILSRSSKGTPDGYSMALFERNRPQIRAMLHDGALAREGLIDLARVDSILTERTPIRGEAYARILSFCDFEAWIQAWA